MCYQLERFLKAQQSYKDNTPIQAYMRECLLNMLLDTKRKDFSYIFEFGCGQCELTYMLTQKLDYKQYICNDINEYKDIKLPQNTQKIFALICVMSQIHRYIHKSLISSLQTHVCNGYLSLRLYRKSKTYFAFTRLSTYWHIWY